MNIGGWVFIILSWALIIIAIVFCFRMVFKPKDDKKGKTASK